MTRFGEANWACGQEETWDASATSPRPVVDNVNFGCDDGATAKRNRVKASDCLLLGRKATARALRAPAEQTHGDRHNAFPLNTLHSKAAVLARKQEVMRRDRLIVYAARDCASCSLKPRCTTAERRFVSRHLHEDALERMNARFQADPSLIRQRRCASEHPFGTIKRMTTGGRFFTRGHKKVSGEAALSVLAYNLIRAINLIGATTLRARLA